VERGREWDSRSQLGKDPEPNISELQRCLTAAQRAIHTTMDEPERRRPRDIRGMEVIRRCERLLLLCARLDRESLAITTAGSSERATYGSAAHRAG